MSHVFAEALRELKLDPVQPVRVWTEGLIIELRVIRSESGDVLMSPWSLQPSLSETEGLPRLGRLMASARILRTHRWSDRDA